MISGSIVLLKTKLFLLAVFLLLSIFSNILCVCYIIMTTTQTTNFSSSTHRDHHDPYDTYIHLTKSSESSSTKPTTLLSLPQIPQSSSISSTASGARGGLFGAGGRFKGGTDPIMEKFNESIGFDKRYVL